MIPLLHATETRTGVAHGDANEDRYVAVLDGFPGPAFAVFDGHNGAAASSYLSDPCHLIAAVGAELRHTIGDDLVDAMARVCHDFQHDQTKHTQLTTEIEQEEARLATLDDCKHSASGDASQAHEIEALEDQVRLLLHDLHACVNQIDLQESVREQFMLQFYALVEQSFPSVVARTFHDVDGKLLQAIDPQGDGSTAIVVWLVGHTMDAGITLYCANVGDSRAVLCRGGKAIALSHDHTPIDPHERERIEQNGGAIRTKHGTTVERVYSPAAAQLLPRGTPIKCLALTRSFGDRQLKQPTKCVTCEPDVRTVRLGQDDVLVVIASDGVWATLSNQDAVDLALKYFGDIETAARAIVWEAQQRGSKDDVTATVVQFGWQDQRAKEIQQTEHAVNQQRQAQEASAFASE